MEPGASSRIGKHAAKNRVTRDQRKAGDPGGAENASDLLDRLPPVFVSDQVVEGTQGDHRIELSDGPLRQVPRVRLPDRLNARFHVGQVLMGERDQGGRIQPVS